MLTKDKFSNLESNLYLIYKILHQYFTSKEFEPKEIKLNFQFSISDRDTRDAFEMLDKAVNLILKNN